ncbi:hypothetical protein MASR2M70_02620 [Bacillota bacterium]
MKTFIRNWDIKQHIAAAAMFYSSIALVGNAFFKKKDVKTTGCNCLVDVCKSMPKKQKIYNSVLLSCFIADVVVSCCMLRSLKKMIDK